ncbi:Pyridoxal 5'-phosphate synthase [Gracilaria domingensis]|nr:Pyridoxal 5'-phosphate synthase [Gracilaria domingensis]
MTKPCICSTQKLQKSVCTTVTSVATAPSVADLRVNYSQQPLEEANLPEDPVQLFTTWFQQAQHAKEPEPNAMCLSTADDAGRPSARMVLLKAFDQTGFVWYTNYQSRKASQLKQNPFACLTFWWPSMERSVRIEGEVLRVSPEESDAYFHSRPPSSRLGAVASDQSRTLDSRQTMERRWDELQSAHLNQNGELIRPIHRPSHWGGYRLVPDRIEFWKGRSARLHDRIVFERTVPPVGQCSLDKLATLQWEKQRLQP